MGEIELNLQEHRQALDDLSEATMTARIEDWINRQCQN